mgnify:CR=1 FL=1
MAVTGKRLSDLYAEITGQFWDAKMVVRNLDFDPARREELTKTLMVVKKLPAFAAESVTVSYQDG